MQAAYANYDYTSSFCSLARGFLILISNLINEVNNVMDLTTVTTVDNETIWVSYRSYIFGSEPLEELLKMAISAVAGTSEYILDRLQMYKII